MGKEKKGAEKKDDKKAGDKKDDKKADAKDAGKDAGKGKGGKGKGKEAAAPAADDKKDDKKAAKPKQEKKVREPVEEEEETKGTSRRARKERYAEKLRKLLNEYKNALIITVDFVGSTQMQQVRIALRNQAVILMGKNTVIRKVIREEAERNNKKLSELLPLVSGNMGIVFTNKDLPHVRKTLQENRVPAAAKAGVLAPDDVFIQAGPTGLDPGQTAFFQALNINTKIARGSIEIINKVHLVKKGERVNSSHVGLLSKLDQKPFSYGIIVTHAYENGSVYDAKVLDLSKDDVMSKWLKGVRLVAALSLAVGQPNLASLPHSISNAFKKLVAISLETGYDFPEAQVFKDYLANPDAHKPKKADKEEEEEEEAEAEEEEEAEESDGEIAGGLFGDDDEDGGKKEKPKEKAKEAAAEEEEEEEEEEAPKKEAEAEEEEEEAEAEAEEEEEEE